MQDFDLSDDKDAAPKTRFRASPAITVTATIDKVLKIRPRDPRARPRKPVGQTHSPALPTLDIFEAIYVDGASTAARCSGCDACLAGCVEVYLVLNALPLQSLCSACFSKPTERVAKALLGNATVRRMVLPGFRSNVPACDTTHANTDVYTAKLREIGANIAALVASSAVDRDKAQLEACGRQIAALADTSEARSHADTHARAADNADDADMRSEHDTAECDRSAPVAEIATFTIVPKPTVTLARCCPACGAHHLHPEVADVDRKRTPFSILALNPCLSWDNGVLVTWICRKCDETRLIKPTFQIAAEAGLWPIRTAHDTSRDIDVSYAHAIFTSRLDISLAAKSRLISHSSMKSDLSTRVLSALEIGYDAQPVSARVASWVLKATLMFLRAQAAAKLREVKVLNIGACIPCAKVPGSLGGGCATILLDGCYQFNNSNGNQPQHAADPDDFVLRDRLLICLSNDELAHSHFLTCEAHLVAEESLEARKKLQAEAAAKKRAETNTATTDSNETFEGPDLVDETATAVDSSLAHGDRAAPGMTDDACTGADCQVGANHAADRPLHFKSLPFHFDPVLEDLKQTKCYVSVHCRHLSVLAAALSSSVEDYALMMALIDSVLNDPAFSPAWFSNPAWPELLRNKLFVIGIYDIGCRFGLLFEQRFLLRHGREAVEALRRAFRARAQLPTIAEAEPVHVNDVADEWTAIPTMPSTVLSTPGLPVDYFGWGVGAFHALRHILRCQARFGQFKVVGTGLVQGDGPEVFNSWTARLAAISRGLRPAALAASFDSYLCEWNALRRRSLVTDCAHKVKAVQAKMLQVETAIQEFDKSHSESGEFTDAQIDEMRNTLLAALPASAAELVETGSTPLSIARTLLVAKQRSAALVLRQTLSSQGPLRMDGIFAPDDEDYLDLLAMFGGMVPSRLNDWEFKPARLLKTIKGANTQEMRLEANLLKACRASAIEQTASVPLSLTRTKAAIAKHITAETRRLHAAVLEHAAGEAAARRLRHVKEWLLVMHKRLELLRIAFAKDRKNKTMERAVDGATAHRRELVCMFNACLASMVQSGEREPDEEVPSGGDADTMREATANCEPEADVQVEQEVETETETPTAADGGSLDVPLDMSLLDRPDFDMGHHIRFPGSIATNPTAGLSVSMMHTRVHLADMKDRCDEEVMTLEGEMDHVPIVLKHVASHLEGAVTTHLHGSDGTGDGCVPPNTGRAFIAWSELAAIRKLQHAHERTFIEWKCDPREEAEVDDESAIGEPSEDHSATASDDECASESELEDDDSDSVIDLTEAAPLL